MNPIAQFEWVRTLDNESQEKSRFINGKPFAIEAGFQLTKSASELQFGFGVRHVQSGVEVFVSPSPSFEEEFLEGHHVALMQVDPNHLQPGLYNVVLKLFCQGTRQETMGEMLFFEIIEDPAISKDDVFMDKWAAGLINVQYKWKINTVIEPVCFQRDETKSFPASFRQAKTE